METKDTIETDGSDVLDFETAKPYLSGGVREIGIETIQQMTKAIKDAEKDNSKLVWISVGSGNAIVEKMLEDYLDIEIITVDPNPNVFMEIPESFKEKHKNKGKHFSLVEELIEKQPEIKGNCVLILNWTAENESIYDIEAIKNLLPLYICSICEVSTGIAAGGEFHKWFLNAVINRQRKDIFEILNSWCYRPALDIREPQHVYYVPAKYNWECGTFKFGVDSFNMEVVLVAMVLQKSTNGKNLRLDQAPKRIKEFFSWKRNHDCIIS